MKYILNKRLITGSLLIILAVINIFSVVLSGRIGSLMMLIGVTMLMIGVGLSTIAIGKEHTTVKNDGASKSIYKSAYITLYLYQLVCAAGFLMSILFHSIYDNYSNISFVLSVVFGSSMLATVVVENMIYEFIKRKK